jgi:hypothetical protein
VKTLPQDIVEPKHPSGRDLSEFERRLCRLRLIGHEAHLLVCSLTRTEDRKADSELAFTLQNYSLILLCRFLEIWSQFQSQAKDNRRVRDIAQAVSPYLDRINTWPGLREFRNWIVAHRYQIDPHPEFIPPWVVINTGRVPSNAPEWILLLECARHVSAAVMAYYGDIYRSLGPVLDPGVESPITQGVRNGDEAQSERLRMAREANERLTALGVDLRDPVFKEFKCRSAEAAV